MLLFFLHAGLSVEVPTPRVHKRKLLNVDEAAIFGGFFSIFFCALRYISEDVASHTTCVRRPLQTHPHGLPPNGDPTLRYILPVATAPLTLRRTGYVGCAVYSEFPAQKVKLFCFFLVGRKV